MKDKNLEIVTISTHSKYYYPSLVSSCKKNKGTLTTLGMGEEWLGYNWRFKKMIEYLKNKSDDTIVCFIDGYDVIVCRDLTELADEFIKLKNKYKCKIIVGCDDYGIIGKKLISNIFYGKCGNNEHNLNAGTYIGYAKDIKDIVTKIYELNPTDSADDQVLMVKYYNQNPGEIHIDHECKLFVALFYPLMNIDNFITIRDNKVYTNENKSMPFFIHAPGNGFLNNIITKLGYEEPDKDVKRKMIYESLKKGYHHIERIIISYKYIILSLLIVLVIVIFYIRNNKRISKKTSKRYENVSKGIKRYKKIINI
jgi:hypothetical protein